MTISIIITFLCNHDDDDENADGVTVSVNRVEIFNREDCCGDWTRNVDVRVSNELPTSASEMFSGGSLLGHFAGPATNGQHIIITGWIVYALLSI